MHILHIVIFSTFLFLFVSKIIVSLKVHTQKMLNLLFQALSARIVYIFLLKAGYMTNTKIHNLVFLLWSYLNGISFIYQKTSNKPPINLHFNINFLKQWFGSPLWGCEIFPFFFFFALFLDTDFKLFITNLLHKCFIPKCALA